MARKRILLAIFLATAVSSPTVEAQTPEYKAALTTLVERMDAASKTGAFVKGKAEVEIDGTEGERTDTAVVLIRGSGDRAELYFEFAGAKTRVLVLGRDAVHVRTPAGDVVEMGLHDDLPGLGFAAADVTPFVREACGTPRVADVGTKRMTFTCEPPEGSTHSMVVYKVRRDRAAPERVMFYRETLSNLVRMRTQKGFAEVDGRWLPREIAIRDFVLRTESSFAIEWSKGTDEETKGFDPASLARPSIFFPPS